MQALVDVGVFVVQVIGLLPQQPVVVLFEGLSRPPGLVGPKSQLGQRFHPQIYGRTQGFPMHAVHAVAQDLVSMGSVLCTRQYLKVWEVFLHHFNHLKRGGRVIDGEYQQFCLVGAGGMQQIEPAGVAVEHLIAVPAQHLYLTGVLLQYGGAYAVAVQQAPHYLAEAAEAGDDDGVLHQFRLLVLRRIAVGTVIEPGLDHPIVEDQQEWRQRHGEGHHQGEQ